jgi:Holliday junction resolvase RusA-like endonuclease
MDAIKPVLTMWVEGTPKAQPRGRHVNGRVVSWAASGHDVKLWRGRVEREAVAVVTAMGGKDTVRGMIGNGGTALRLRFVMPTKDATRWGRPHTAKPDADNLAKLVMDVLAKAGAIGGDDARTAALVVEKAYGASPGCRIQIGALATPPGPDTGHVNFSDGEDGVPEWLRG